MKIDTILVTSDLSDSAERAFAPAAALARESGAKIELIHVVDDTPVPPAGAPLAPALHAPDLESTVAACEKKLASQRAALGDDIEVNATVIVATGPADAVCTAARELGADLIVISTHGRTGLRRFVLGSVAESVVRHARVPVLVVPPTE